MRTVFGVTVSGVTAECTVAVGPGAGTVDRKIVVACAVTVPASIVLTLLRAIAVAAAEVTAKDVFKRAASSHFGLTC
jgi:hypothetical protein